MPPAGSNSGAASRAMCTVEAWRRAPGSRHDRLLYLRSNSYIMIPPATATFRDCFHAQHGDAHEGIAFGGQLRVGSFHLVAENHGQRKTRIPFEKVLRMSRCFDRGQLVAAVLERANRRQGIAAMLPLDLTLGAERGLCNAGMRGASGIAGENELGDAGAVGIAEKSPYVVGAADPVEHDDHGQRRAHRESAPPRRKSFILSCQPPQ